MNRAAVSPLAHTHTHTMCRLQINIKHSTLVPSLLCVAHNRTFLLLFHFFCFFFCFFMPHAQKNETSRPKYTNTPRCSSHALNMLSADTSPLRFISPGHPTSALTRVEPENIVVCVCAHVATCLHPQFCCWGLQMCLFPVSILLAFFCLQHLCASTLLHKHLCKIFFLSFCAGGNNFIVWVNPKWAEQQKQSFSDALFRVTWERERSRELLIHFFKTFFFFYQRLVIYHLVGPSG